MRSSLAGLLIGTALALAAPADAHRMWLLPSATSFSGSDDWVTVDAAVSNDLFYPDHFPLTLAQVRVWAPDGSAGQIQNGATGRYRSVFDVRLDKPGTWKIGTQMDGIMGSFKVNGEERRVGMRRPGPPPSGGSGAPQAGGPGAGRPAPVAVEDIPADATDVHLTQTISRNEIFVTAGAPTTTVLQPSGKGLEMVPVTHPDELVANEPATFRFLVDGKPVPGLTVTVIPGGKRYRDTEGAMQVVTAADGAATIRWPMAGMFWLNATLTDQHPTLARATDRRLSYTTTLEVLAP